MKKYILALFLLVGLLLTIAPAPAQADHIPPPYYKTCFHDRLKANLFRAPCVWDAKHMGDGKGRSFIIGWSGVLAGDYRYISHKRAHRLAQQWIRFERHELGLDYPRCPSNPFALHQH